MLGQRVECFLRRRSRADRVRLLCIAALRALPRQTPVFSQLMELGVDAALTTVEPLRDHVDGHLRETEANELPDFLGCPPLVVPARRAVHVISSSVTSTRGWAASFRSREPSHEMICRSFASMPQFSRRSA